MRAYPQIIARTADYRHPTWLYLYYLSATILPGVRYWFCCVGFGYGFTCREGARSGVVRRESSMRTSSASVSACIFSITRPR